ncbi:MAG: hypothetical protein JNJ88_02260 [Planctomycetes bacterium]|nr:hypothetical protein [Planctomycetota bacterium]
MLERAYVPAPLRGALASLAIAALLALSACASGGSSSSAARSTPERTAADLQDTGPYKSEFTIPGRRVYVELFERNERRTTAIVNRGQASPADAYAANAREGVMLKVATDARMADFHEGLRRLGFFEMSTSEADPNARWSLALDVDGRRRVANCRLGLDPATAEKYVNLKKFYFALFNDTLALRPVQNPDGARLFEREQKSVKQNVPDRR